MFACIAFCIGEVLLSVEGRKTDILCRTYFCFLHLLAFRLETLGELKSSTKPLSRSVCTVQEELVLFLGSLLRLSPDLCNGFCKTAFWSNWRLLLIHSHCWFHQSSVSAGGISHLAADSARCALALMVNFSFMLTKDIIPCKPLFPYNLWGFFHLYCHILGCIEAVLWGQRTGPGHRPAVSPQTWNITLCFGCPSASALYF